MATYWFVILFVLGAVIGSFLNVVLYRMHTGKSLSGRSHCMTCGKTLSWTELLPVVSYLWQRGACTGCSAYIPSRYFVVEVLTGLLFAWVWHLFSPDLTLVALHLILVSLFVVIVVYDIRHTIIPDELTLGVVGVAAAYVAYEFVQYHDFMQVVWRIGAGLVAALFFYGLWYISKGRWIGFGDAKLAFPLGVIVGVTGVFSMIVLSFWVGAAISLSLLGIERLLKRGKRSLHFMGTPLTIKSEVPFAPFLVLGFLIVQFLHADIFDITYVIFFP